MAGREQSLGSLDGKAYQTKPGQGEIKVRTERRVDEAHYLIDELRVNSVTKIPFPVVLVNLYVDSLNLYPSRYQTHLEILPEAVTNDDLALDTSG